MSDELKTFEIIDSSAIVDIKIGMGYYALLQNTIAYVCKDKSIEELNQAHEQIKNQNITEEWIKHYETLLILCHTIDKNAREQGKTRNVSQEEMQKIINGEN